jgi:hypothetical protein
MVFELKQRVGRGERPHGGFRGDPGSSDLIPPPLREMVEACWRQVPSERPTFAQLATLDLEGLHKSEELVWPGE